VDNSLKPENFNLLKKESFFFNIGRDKIKMIPSQKELWKTLNQNFFIKKKKFIKEELL